MTYDIPAILLGIGNALFIAVLLSWHVKDNEFDFRETLVENGKISLSRLGQLTALVVSTGVLVHEVVKGRLTEWLLFGYLTAWCGTYLANKWSPPKKDAP